MAGEPLGSRSAARPAVRPWRARSRQVAVEAATDLTNILGVFFVKVVAGLATKKAVGHDGGSRLGRQ